MANNWTDITNGQVDPDSPITTSLMTALRDNPEGLAAQTSGAPSLPSTRIFHVQEQKSSGTPSASVVAANYITRRDLVEVTDTLGADGSGGGSIGGANNTDITLPLGRYFINAYSVAGGTSSATTEYNLTSQLQLYNTSDTSIELSGLTNVNYVYGHSSGSKISLLSFLSGEFFITGTKTFNIRQYLANYGTAAHGGQAASSGATEIYTDAVFYRLNLTGT